MTETDLIIESEGETHPFPPFSARECTQTLTLLPQGGLRRTLGGELVCVGQTFHQKFASLITCKDHGVPAFDKFRRGTLLKVGCIQSLTQSIPQGATIATLKREPLSFHLYDSKGTPISAQKREGEKIFLPTPFPGGFITYRPWLMMLVKGYHIETAEWGLGVSWVLELEER